MISRILCTLGFHVGKFDQGKAVTDRTIQQDGTKHLDFMRRQTRYCTECGEMQIKETKTGYEHHPAWEGDDVASNHP